MENTNWLRQTLAKPYFLDIQWSKPQNRHTAGKPLIVGGNAHVFVAPAIAYAAAQKAGVGTLRVLLPDSTKKQLGQVPPAAEFTPSTASGSFRRQAIAQLHNAAAWADAVLLAGDFGRNSETAIFLETAVHEYEGPLILAQDALDYFLTAGSPILARPSTLLVINLAKLQKLAKNNRPTTPVLQGMSLYELAVVLADWVNSTPAIILTKQGDSLVVAAGGQVSTTPQPQDSNWQIELGAFAGVWWLQNLSRPFEAVTTAVWDYSK